MAAPDESPPPMRPARRATRPVAIEFAAGARIARADIPGLCERARKQMEGANADRLVCDVGAVLEPDAVTVDALARLQLTARRVGRQLRLEHASPQLRELLAFMGLSGVMPLAERSGFEAGSKTEEREQGGGVEEERNPADSTA